MKVNYTTKGFTLVEIMVSIAIFTIIITVGIGALLSVITSYRASEKEKEVHDSLNYVLESMTREIRLGKDYYASADSDGTDEGSISDGIGDSLGFNASDNRGYVVYYIDDGVLMVRRSGATNAQNGVQALSDDGQIIIEGIRFTVIGTDPLSTPNYNQPLVWIQLQATAIGEDTRETTVQTLVSQRTLDA
ncbi:prepilin-type N-terminal cleavage/methylation domain-containing protein [Patescibacteria group bacterium]|nr:prepilin-type N-terminal cleavage/methylation domain-containing protein [Patescibacteria group bacterium]